jgi:hypothetical protein
MVNNQVTALVETRLIASKLTGYHLDFDHYQILNEYYVVKAKKR